MQCKQSQWLTQWQEFTDKELFLFQDWIYPNTLESLRGKRVLECGCGGGQHTNFMAPYAAEITAVDLNTVTVARERNAAWKNVRFADADIASMRLGKYDVVISIGVIHHTDNPDATFANLVEHLAKGGKIIIWVYSREGNFLVRRVVEPLRRVFLSRLPPKALRAAAIFLTALIYPAVYTVYRLPFRGLPYYEYFQNFRRLGFNRNLLNVYDKINAPQVDFISRERIKRWFADKRLRDVQITPYKGVSWRAYATMNG